MKRLLLLLTVLSFFTVTSSVLYADPVDLNFKVSGNVILLGNPFIGPFSTIPSGKGKGPLGKFTGEGLYVYEPFGPNGEMICGGGQLAIRLESTGEMLLLNVAPGPTGIMNWVGPEAFTWTQTWTGVVAGGTGRFEYATGTFSKTLNGSGALPGFVQVYEGNIDIHLD